MVDTRDAQRAPGPDGPSAEDMADSLLSRPRTEAEAYFALFHHGLRPEDLAEEFGV